MKNFPRNALGTVLILVLIPSPAFADAGVPMLFVTFPAICMALLPVVLLEAWVMARRTKAGFRKSLATSAAANAASTLLGIPLTWAVLVALEMLATGGGGVVAANPLLGNFLSVTLYAPWLLPDEINLYWMVPTASLVLLIPFFLMSWWVEYGVARLLNREIPPGEMKETEWKMNLCSYALLALFNLLWLAYSFIKH